MTCSLVKCFFIDPPGGFGALSGDRNPHTLALQFPGNGSDVNSAGYGFLIRCPSQSAGSGGIRRPGRVARRPNPARTPSEKIESETSPRGGTYVFLFLQPAIV